MTQSGAAAPLSIDADLVFKSASVRARDTPQPKHSFVIPSEVEGSLKCRTRHTNRRGPSTTLRMTTLRGKSRSWQDSIRGHKMCTSKVRRFALEVTTAAVFTNKLTVAGLNFAAHGHNVRSSVDRESFERIVVEIHLVRFR